MYYYDYEAYKGEHKGSVTIPEGMEDMVISILESRLSKMDEADDESKPLAQLISSLLQQT